jgi:hypothetical protein
MQKSESIIELSKALAKFQAEVKQPMKDADNPFFKSKYVPLENVVEAISKCAPNHGLSFVQWPSNDEQGRVGVSTLLMHESGEYIEFDPVYMNAEKNTPQGAGSLITYLKRYSLSAVFGITSDVDDDANDSSGNNNKGKAADPLTEKLTVTFSQAMQQLGGAANVYRELDTNQQTMKKLFNSKNKKEKEETLKQLEGLVHDNRNAG